MSELGTRVVFRSTSHECRGSTWRTVESDLHWVADANAVLADLLSAATAEASMKEILDKATELLSVLKKLGAALGLRLAVMEDPQPLVWQGSHAAVLAEVAGAYQQMSEILGSWVCDRRPNEYVPGHVERAWRHVRAVVRLTGGPTQQALEAKVACEAQRALGHSSMRQKGQRVG